MKHTLILSLMLVGMTACTAAPTPKTSRPAHWAQSVKADAKAEMLQGGFGYHSVWKNLENLFTEETLAEVKTELAALRR